MNHKLWTKKLTVLQCTLLSKVQTSNSRINCNGSRQPTLITFISESMPECTYPLSRNCDPDWGLWRLVASSAATTDSYNKYTCTGMTRTLYSLNKFPPSSKIAYRRKQNQLVYWHLLHDITSRHASMFTVTSFYEVQNTKTYSYNLQMESKEKSGM